MVEKKRENTTEWKNSTQKEEYDRCIKGRPG